MDGTRSGGAKRASIAQSKMSDIKTFKTSSGRAGPNGGTEYTHVPSGAASGAPPSGFKTWHEFYGPGPQRKGK